MTKKAKIWAGWVGCAIGGAGIAFLVDSPKEMVLSILLFVIVYLSGVVLGRNS